MKIGSCTVLFNPDEQVISNLETYVELVDVSVIIDNSEFKNDISQRLKRDDRFIYLDMNGNKGIAAALNKGIEYICNMGLEFVLTMDQDSQFPKCYSKNIIKLLDKYKSDFSVIGLNFNHRINDNSEDIVVVPYWLTSGNFVNVSDFMKIGGFTESLFIDYVDIEYGYKLYKNNLKICYLEGYSLIHKIGNPIEIRIFNKKYYSMNHSPIRYYYRYRNSSYLHRIDKKFFRREYLRELFINIPKMLIFEHKRKEKIKMIRKGIMDARIGKMGVYNEEVI